jgi:alkane 1-monooxygenase
MLWWAGIPAGLLVAVGALWGPMAVGLGVAQALFAIFILEDVNYIEHYGLRRSLTLSGRCPCMALHVHGCHVAS